MIAIIASREPQFALLSSRILRGVSSLELVPLLQIFYCFHATLRVSSRGSKTVVFRRPPVVIMNSCSENKKESSENKTSALGSNPSFILIFQIDRQSGSLHCASSLSARCTGCTHAHRPSCASPQLPVTLVHRLDDAFLTPTHLPCAWFQA